MVVLAYLRRFALRNFMEIRWQVVITAIAAYSFMSYTLLWMCGEQAMIENITDFIYYLVVTGSTVGYGDFSPVTPTGKIVTALFIIPGGLGIFTLSIARFVGFVTYQWRKGLMGMKRLDYEDHILIIGWNGHRTLRLVKQLLREIELHKEDTKIALCVKADIENPMRESLGFVRVSSFSSDEEMHRAGVHKAKSIIIDNPDDDISMTTALYCANENPDAHTICYFRDDSLGGLLKKHCPNIECMPSVAIEMIAKSTLDPGSSALHHQLLDVDVGMTQYSTKYTGNGTQAGALFEGLKSRYDATLIGVSTDGYGSIELNPALNFVVPGGATLYYIADERIKGIDWGAFHV